MTSKRSSTTVRARHHAHLTAPRPGDVLKSVSAGPSGEAVALWVAAGDLPEGAGPASRVKPSVPAHVTVHQPDQVLTVRLAGLKVDFPSVQPLPGGRFLVVGARCRWRKNDPERNAFVYDATGAVEAAHTFGDGIEHVQATRDGEVWVAYFDEGVYGNFGWGEADSPAPVGSCGLIRFSADLTRQWRYPSHWEDEWGAISDCYALNVGDSAAWACYYTDFPVVRIDDAVSGWHNEVRGAKALAVAGDRIALYGGYGPDRHRLVVGVLANGRVEVTGKFRLVLPDGRSLPRTAEVVGRGSDLHVFAGDEWSRLGVEDIGR
ncbi:hypothetical protein AB0A63_11485 [Lentzea sp. NPDC042327]|uniref:hypothetical protein n=1 Tax=Lentzea sp. NPDC042327 TaxID=3154801 RepID=UPI0033E0CD26